VAEKARKLYPGGLPTADIRSIDEPLLGLTEPDPAPAAAAVRRDQPDSRG
jgi:hypothetical protein